MTQADRSRAMQARLLEATVELLVERGFAGTSTTLVSERAGVSPEVLAAASCHFCVKAATIALDWRLASLSRAPSAAAA